jgi:hypothetical protein
MNWHDIQKIETLQIRLGKLGYVMRQSKHSYSGEYNIGVYPLDRQLPIYSRDAELFSGTVEMIEAWIRGVYHKNEYLLMLKAITDEKIKNLEQKYIKIRIHKGMLEKIKNPDKTLDKHTQDFIDLQSK